MLVGYARVSTADQTLGLQKDAVTSAWCERLFTDTASGARADRPGLDEALDFLRPGDTLVVWRLDRLGRSLRHLIDTLGGLDQRGSGSNRCRSRSTPPPAAANSSSTSSAPSPNSNAT